MIKLFAMDVDGTLTDGGLILHGAGGESKRFDVQDGLGIVRLQAAGVEVAFVSGRRSPATLRRADELGVRVCRQGVGDKLAVLQELAAERGLDASEVAFAGDDLNDVACLRWAGWGVAVANAVAEAKDAADVVTRASGGAGALREAAELLLKRVSAGA